MSTKITIVEICFSILLLMLKNVFKDNTVKLTNTGIANVGDWKLCSVPCSGYMGYMGSRMKHM